MSSAERPRVTRGFRLGLAGAALLTWGVVVVLMPHESEQRTVLGRYSTAYFSLLAVVATAALALSLAQAPAVLRRVHALRWAALSVVSSLVLGVALTEVVVRAGDMFGASYYEEMAHYVRDRVPDPELVYAQRRSWGTTYQGVEVRTNELGFRDDPLVPKTPGELRVLVLGDSVAFGWGVAQEQIFSALLEQRLASRLDRLVRVLNGGVCSYNTVQQLALLHRDGLPLQPDFVILIYVPNDIAVHESFDQHARPPWLDMSPPQKLFTLAHHLWSFRVADHLILNRERYLWHLGRVGIRPEETPGWGASLDALAELERVTRARGLGFAVFFARMRPAPEEERLLRAVREASGAAFAEDISVWFRELPLEDVTNSRVDAHPNARGHAIYADQIARHVLARLDGVGRAP